LGIHLGTGALRGIIRRNRSHHNGADGLYLRYRVQNATSEKNRSWANGQDRISIGHKDTDNLFVRNVVYDNDRVGVYFRNDKESNVGHRNTLRENVIENNGRQGAPGSGVRIEGSTRHITVESNTIRETRTGEEATQKVDIYIGPKADYITCQQNHFEGNLKRAILDESQGTNNKLELAAPTQSSIQ
jgi:pectate lyase